MYIYRKVENHYGMRGVVFPKQQWFRQNVVELLLAGASFIGFLYSYYIGSKVPTPNMYIFPILNLITMIVYDCVSVQRKKVQKQSFFFFYKTLNTQFLILLLI